MKKQKNYRKVVWTWSAFLHPETELHVQRVSRKGRPHRDHVHTGKNGIKIFIYICRICIIVSVYSNMNGFNAYGYQCYR